MWPVLLWSQCVSFHITCWTILVGCSSVLPHLPLSLEPTWQVGYATWQLLPSEAHTHPVAMFLQLLFHFDYFSAFLCMFITWQLLPSSKCLNLGPTIWVFIFCSSKISSEVTLCIAFCICRLCFHFHPDMCSVLTSTQWLTATIRMMMMNSWSYRNRIAQLVVQKMAMRSLFHPHMF